MLYDVPCIHMKPEGGFALSVCRIHATTLLGCSSFVWYPSRMSICANQLPIRRWRKPMEKTIKTTARVVFKKPLALDDIGRLMVSEVFKRSMVRILCSMSSRHFEVGGAAGRLDTLGEARGLQRASKNYQARSLTQRKRKATSLQVPRMYKLETPCWFPANFQVTIGHHIRRKHCHAMSCSHS